MPINCKGTSFCEMAKLTVDWFYYRSQGYSCTATHYMELLNFLLGRRRHYKRGALIARVNEA